MFPLNWKKTTQQTHILTRHLASDTAINKFYGYSKIQSIFVSHGLYRYSDRIDCYLDLEYKKITIVEIRFCDIFGTKICDRVRKIKQSES